MAETQTYTGQCHCGAVTYRATTDLGSLMDCNCSRCIRLGWIMQSVAASQFELLSGEDALTPYHFNTDRIDHLFCKVCGIESFARGAGPDGQTIMMINVNCLDGVPPVDRATITHWDGKSI